MNRNIVGGRKQIIKMFHSDFNVDAIIYMYGSDGFELPNRKLNYNYFKYGLDGAPSQPNNLDNKNGNGYEDALASTKD